MNTLFRFTESLKAVDDFRKLWRQMDASDANSIIERTEKETAARVS